MKEELVGMIKADSPPEGIAVSIEAVADSLKEWGYPVQLTRSSRSSSQPSSYEEFLNYHPAIKMGPRSFLVRPPAGELPFEVEARMAFHFEPHGLSYRELVVYIPATREMPHVLQTVTGSMQAWANDLYDREAASARVVNLGKTPVRRVVIFHVSSVWRRRAEVLEQQGHKLIGPRTNMEIP